MYLTSVIASIFIAAVAAQNSTDLPDLVSQLPQCALSCFTEAAADVNCSASDLPCLCSQSADFVNKITPCVALSSCSSTDLGTLSKLAPEICADVEADQNSTAVASASNVLNSALGTATASASSSASATGNAAVRPEMGIGLLGAAALAAFAI